MKMENMGTEQNILAWFYLFTVYLTTLLVLQTVQR
jgi:hypothetical protein